MYYLYTNLVLQLHSPLRAAEHATVFVAQLILLIASEKIVG